LIKEIGFKSFFAQFDYDLKAARQFIKIKYPRTEKSNKHTHYNKMLNEMYAKLTIDQRNFNNQFISEITEKLKTA